MSINVNDKNLGHATAYAYYKAGGGTMTEAEFTEFMADFGTASQTAVEAAQAALASKNAAQTAATTATNKATEATTAATTATTKAGEASTSASTATSAKDTAVSASQTATTKATEATTAAATAVSAKDDAVSANTAAQSAKTAAQTAQAGAETAAASVSASAAQIATNAEDISQLKSDLDADEARIEAIENDMYPYETTNANLYDTVNGYRLTTQGTRKSDAGFVFRKYIFDKQLRQFYAKLHISNDNTSGASYQWQTSDGVSGSTNTYLIGEPVSGGADDVIAEVPYGDGDRRYVYLVVCESTTNETNKIENVTYQTCLPDRVDDNTDAINHWFGQFDFDSGYRVNRNGYISNLVSDSDYVSKLFKVAEGEVIKVAGTSTNTVKLWYTLNADGEILRYKDTTSVAVITDDVTIQSGEVLFCFNTAEAATGKYCYINNPVTAQVVNTRGMIKEQAIYTLENNLTTDGAFNLGDCSIKLNNVESLSNYGATNAVYKFPLKKVDKLHVCFDFVMTDLFPFIASNDYYPLCSIYGELVQACYFPNQLVKPFGEVVNSGEVGARYTNGSNETAVSKTTLGRQFEYFKGDVAFYISYTGEYTSEDAITCAVASNVLTFAKNGNTIDTVTFNGTDTVDSLIASINDVTDFSCVSMQTTGKQCKDLIIYNRSITINFGYTYTDVDSQTQNGLYTVNIPYTVDTTLHNVEIIVDMLSSKAYVAIDGRTEEVSISSTISEYSVEIGSRHNSADTPIKVSNLVIDYNHLGDAEVIESVVYEGPNSDATVTKQLISSRNPKVLVWEAHKIELGSDADYESTAEHKIAVTPDRLFTIFDKLKLMGYFPISWQDFIGWKINGKQIPKRSYLMMFDDWRLENYVDYRRRISFGKFDVKPGLAVISDQYALSQTFTIDGEIWTAEEMIDMTIKAGWYPCSHTTEHFNLSKYSNDELATMLKDFAYSCNKHRIFADVLVYPGGNYEHRITSVLDRSPFKLGIVVVTGKYVCKLSNKYYIPRIDLSSPYSISKVLAQIT